MSRRPPNPNAERAAQNTQTIKSLLKLEGNKSCADCKRNKRQCGRELLCFYILLTDASQIHDGPAGISEYSFAFDALAYIVAWALISAG